MPNTIAETNHFIILNDYTKIAQAGDYQTEADLERELIADLISQGYEHRPDITSNDKLYDNLRIQMQRLNDTVFSDSEWQRFMLAYLDAPSDSIVDKTRKIHDDYVCDFTFDDGRVQNIYLMDKDNLARNHLQVIGQFSQKGSHANRYDVTILINGLPLVQIELKKRGIAIREAFNQVHRYSKESFNADNSLFKFLQIFVISNGTDTRYFANTTKRNKNSFDFTINWAKSDNTLIKDLKDFTATFFQKNTLMKVLAHYCVFDVSDTLLLMRPYQIAAAERILWKIMSSYHAKVWSDTESGGYIWHTTGSGKTLTSFKAARLATALPFIDKVFFVVDRKDLDDQTMKEYQRFSPNSVNGSNSTAKLKANLDADDNKIIVTTIQKLNNLMRGEVHLPIYDKQVVFIFDECHRSQFGEAQKNLQKKFKKYYQFGFTGTPIFSENALGSETTASVFGRQLHSYVLTDAIRDEKVLKFKVDYNDVRPQFKALENETDELKLTAAENRQALLHPARIGQISQYICDNFKLKTHRNNPTGRGFNAMFAVSSVDAAKLYYETLKRLQADKAAPLKIATIFSFAANEASNAVGEISDESFEVEVMNSTAKEFLAAVIDDYNAQFKTNFSVDSKQFENYYRDLARRVKGRDDKNNALPDSEKVDLLIVVGMFLTGFDAPELNTLFVDKNLRYHGLIQAYSRTNRIYDATKAFGNIVTFRNLEADTIKAITLFGDKNTANVILEKSYAEQMQGGEDTLTGEARRGFIEIITELQDKFPEPENLEREADKKAFVKLFGEYLQAENILQNYDEFHSLKALQNLDMTDSEAVAAFQEAHHISDDEMAAMQAVQMPSERLLQDYRSSYNDIRDWIRKQKHSENQNSSKLDWDDVVFEVDLLKSQEINLDYILDLIVQQHAKNATKAEIIDEIRRAIRSSISNRAKEGLIIDFINATDLDTVKDTPSVIEAFFGFARIAQKQEAAMLITENQLNTDAAKRYIMNSLKREYASEYGTELSEILPKMSPLNPKYRTLKQAVLAKIADFVEKFKGVGGEI